MAGNSGHLAKLIAAIRLLAGEGKLRAEWEAGSDNTLLSLTRMMPDGSIQPFVDGSDQEQNAASDAAYSVVRLALIETFDLPNATDGYEHHGHAVITIDHAGQPTAEHVFSRDFRMADEWAWSDPTGPHAPPRYRQPLGRIMRWTIPRLPLGPDQADDVITVAIAPHHSAESVLHRAEITLVGEVDRALAMRAEVIVDVVNGDEVVLDDETIDHFNELTLGVLMQLVELLPDKQFGDIKGRLVGRYQGQSIDPEPAGIYIEAQVEPGTTVNFNVVHNGYDILRLFNDDTVALNASTRTR